MSELSNPSRQQPEPKPFTVSVQRSTSGATVIHVTGDMASPASSELHRVVTEELQGPPGLVALELSGVESFDDSGVQALVSAALLAEDAAASFCLVGIESGPVLARLEMAHRADLFETFASVNEAVAYSR